MRPSPEARPYNAAPRYRTVASETAAAGSVGLRAEAAKAQAAKFFFDVRRGLRLARVAIANRIGTDPKVIEALETGALDKLPAWPETVRIVTAYTHIIGMDPRPVLHALHFAYAHHQELMAKRTWFERLRSKIANANDVSDDARGLRSQRLKWAAGISVPAALAGSLMLTSGLQASQLSRPLASMFGIERDTRAESIRRLEGMVWIDAADPRQRRGDKLPGNTR